MLRLYYSDHRAFTSFTIQHMSKIIHPKYVHIVGIFAAAFFLGPYYDSLPSRRELFSLKAHIDHIPKLLNVNK